MATQPEPLAQEHQAAVEALAEARARLDRLQAQQKVWERIVEVTPADAIDLGPVTVALTGLRLLERDLPRARTLVADLAAAEARAGHSRRAREA